MNDEPTNPPVEPVLIPDAPAARGKRPATSKGNERVPNRLSSRKKHQAKLIAIEPRLIITALRQIDLIQYLTLESLLENQRAFIFGALQKGVPVEPGVHSAWIENFKLVVK